MTANAGLRSRGIYILLIGVIGVLLCAASASAQNDVPNVYPTPKTDNEQTAFGTFTIKNGSILPGSGVIDGKLTGTLAIGFGGKPSNHWGCGISWLIGFDPTETDRNFIHSQTVRITLGLKVFGLYDPDKGGLRLIFDPWQKIGGEWITSMGLGIGYQRGERFMASMTVHTAPGASNMLSTTVHWFPFGKSKSRGMPIPAPAEQ